MKKNYKSLSQQLMILSLCSAPLLAAPCQAAPAIPHGAGNAADALRSIRATALPTGGTAVQGIDSIRTTTNGRMEIRQDAPKAVIRWQTFDIGKDASVRFNQQGHADWKALNAIGDANPSQVRGRLSADGEVYLINRNGIYFGPDAQVNVHNLTASALNLKEEEFLSGYSSLDGETKKTTFRNEDGAAGGTVENHGRIRVATGGSVMLIGGKVENSGTIEARQGQVALAAGNEVTVTDSGRQGRKLVPQITTSGDEAVATNLAGGTIEADEGMAGLYGGIVNQAGRVLAMTAVERNGQIELVATRRLTTSAGSLTATPVSESKERQGVAEFSTGEIVVNAPEVVLGGTMTSPGGNIAVTAEDSISLKPGSALDVSGVTVQEAASDRLLEVQLNTEVLKDAQVLKQGPLLGQKVKVDILSGMPAADLSGAIKNRVLSAAERLTKGGSISLTTTSAKGSIKVPAGAKLSFAGGGLQYAGGPLDLTRVRVGNRSYTLAELPEGVPVDEVLGLFERNHERYGITEKWYGSYSRGGTPMLNSVPALFLGADAGSLTIQSPLLSLAGILDGHAKAGITQIEDKEWEDARGRLNALGHKRPRGGEVSVGVEVGNEFGSGAISDDAITEAIVVRGGAGGKMPSTPQGTRVSVIEADALNAARLSAVNLYANTTLVIDKGASVQLMPGGSFRAMGRQVEHNGKITAPGGAVTLAAISNKTSFQTLDNAAKDRLEEKVTIAAGSVIDVSGEIIDNSGPATDEIRYGITKGGSIDLANRSAFSADGNSNPNHSGRIIFSEGALLAARGGYWRGPMGTLKGGDAGSVSIATSGVTDPFVTVDGELEGQALLGNKGGTLTIKAASVAVVPDGGPLPQKPATPKDSLSDLRPLLVIADNRFAKTGFSSINLQAEYDLTVFSGARLEPSRLRLAPPTGSALAAGTGAFTEASPIDAGMTKISLSAGKIVDDREMSLTVEQGATLAVMPGGVIELKGDVSTGTEVTIAGTLAAPAGDITVEGKDIRVTKSGKLLAAGTVLPVLAPAGPGGGLINQRVLDGGKITLDASQGSIDVARGAILDVSGSAKITNVFPDAVAGFYSREEAGAPGSLAVTYGNSFLLTGTVKAASQLQGLPGGSVSLTRSDLLTSLFVPEVETLAKLGEAGFDDFTLSSPAGLSFEDGTRLEAARGLTLDAPLLNGDGGVSVSAPWVRLVNTHEKTVTPPPEDERTGEFLVDAGFIDIEGDLQLRGFQTTALRAAHDIRLADRYYKGHTPKPWSGQLVTGGDLLLQAEAVYPLTNCNFTLDSGGLLTVLPQAGRHPIYSAAGKLTVKAATIDHRGVLAAPMGELVLDATGRVQLAPGSLLSVHGEGEVALGTLRFGAWITGDKESVDEKNPKPVQQPAGKLTVSAAEIVALPGSVMDAGAGGSVSGREFQPGIAGTVNPLTMNSLTNQERLIIVADNSVNLPGRAVYIEGDEALGLKAGVYSILPESFGFLPNALVLEEYNGDTFPGLDAVNSLGQPVVAGYETVAGTGLKPASMKGYTLRTASDVLREGKFDLKSLAVTDGGAITLSGQSVVLAGEIAAPGLDSGLGGTLTAAGTAIRFGLLPSSTIPVSAVESLPEDLTGGMFIAGNTLRGAGLSGLTLGDDETESVTLTRGSVIEGIPRVTLLAKDAILLEQGAAIRALGKDDTEGVLGLRAGSLTTEKGSLLHASHELTFDLGKGMDLRGDWRVDHGRLRFISDRILMGGTQAGQAAATGLLLTDDMLGKVAGIDDLDLWIQSRSDIGFRDSLALEVAGRLTLDAGRLMVESGAVPGQTVHIRAGEITLKNSGPASTASLEPAAGHALELDAGRFTLGPGKVHFDTFQDVTLASEGDMVFQGKAALDAGMPATGTLELEAARFRAAFPAADLPFTPSSLTVKGHDGEVVFRGTSGPVPAASPAGVPGKIKVTAGGITLNNAHLALPGGVIDLRATGENGDLSLLGATFLDLAGGTFPFLPSPGDGVASPAYVLPGGLVSLHSAQGDIELGSEAAIDVSDPENGQAGGVELTAAKGAVNLAGTLRGEGGGSFSMDTLALDDFGALNRKLSANGFSGDLGLRVRTGDILVSGNEVVAARGIGLAADQGVVTIHGTLRAEDGEDGGRVSIYAGGDLLLDSTGAIEAQGTGDASAGGEVFLSSAAGAIETKSGSRIDVSGRGDGNGTVTFRVLRSGEVVPLTTAGEILGSRRTAVQAVKRYEDSSITSTDLTAWKTDAGTFMDRVAKPLGMVIVPEVEVWSTGPMTLQGGLDSLATWRSGGMPGVLTFRSGGDLKVETDVIDTPTPLDSNLNNTTTTGRLISPDGRVDSFGYNFVAGADLQAADFMATGETGDLSFGKTGAACTVYTESAPIRFASGGATTVLPPPNKNLDHMYGVRYYSLATFDGSIEGRTGGDLDLSSGGILQTATGDIRLHTGGDILLGANDAHGAIRTTGRAPEWSEVPQWLRDYRDTYNDSLKILNTKDANNKRLARYWDYRDGGSIDISARGNIVGRINASGNGWDASSEETIYLDPINDQNKVDSTNHLNANFGGLNATTGVAAMAGGEVRLRAEGDIRGQAAVFGPGNLTVSAGGDLDGRFLAIAGDLSLSTYGSFGQLDADVPVETGGGDLSLHALGGIALGVIDNPDLLNDYIGSPGLYYTLGYTPSSTASVVAVNGDVEFSGKNSSYHTNNTQRDLRGQVLPPSLSIIAGRDIGIRQANWLMAPSPQGGLHLIAGRDISGAIELPGTTTSWTQGGLIMSDADPAAYYGTQQVNDLGAAANLYGQMRSGHQGTALHADDENAILIHAGRDLADLALALPKKAVVRAERDIRNILYIGQNINEDDLSVVSAGHDLSLAQSTGFTKGYRGIQQAGPGALLVQAGNDMELGISETGDFFGTEIYGGIVTYGSALNPALQSGMSALDRPKGSDVAIIVGYDLQPGRDELDAFVDSLRQEGKRFSEALNSGDTDGAAAIKEEIRTGLLDDFLGGHRAGDGVLNMTSSTINTKSGEDSIAIITGGEVNVGLSTINTADTGRKDITRDSGIFTTSGGDISIVTMGQDVEDGPLKGNINVNESRVMTFLGGDLLLLSDYGDINAGRGSRTTVVAAPPRVTTVRKDNGTPDPSDDYDVKTQVFDPPAAGSGLRALAFDPDGTGALQAPEPGDMYVVAWDGVVDAGEAGIEGGRLYLAATQVLNAQNISVGVGSVGVPAAAAAPAGLGALSGNSTEATASTASDIVKETSSADKASAAEKIAETARKMADALTQLRFFVVKFMGFIDGEAIAAENPPAATPAKDSRDSSGDEDEDEDERSKSRHK